MHRLDLPALATALVAGLVVAPLAHAQTTVIDPTGPLAQAKELECSRCKKLSSSIPAVTFTQLQQLQQELQTVQWVAQTGQALIQNPNLGTVMALAGQLGLNNDLPISPYAVQGLVSGYGGMTSLSSLTGKLSGLSGLVNGSWSTDHIYTCTDQSFACQQQQQMASSTAGLKGVMGTLYQDLANHVAVLQGLRDKASTATDPAQRENVLEQVALENSWATNTGNQLQASLGMFQAQQQANVNRENEQLSASITAVIAAAPK